MPSRAPLPAPLRGIVPPLVTPLRTANELDRAGLARLVEHLISGGVAGLFVLGTTGEGPALPYRMRYEVIEETCTLAAGRVPVLVGATDTSLAEALEVAYHATDCGTAAIVAAPPFYHPLTPADVVRHFTLLAEGSPLPLFLYNIPPCAHVEVTREIVAACTQLPNVAGIKDSSGDLAHFRRLLELRSDRPDWSFLMGPEHLLAEATAAGSDGGVNGGANLDPRLFVELFRAADSRTDGQSALPHAGRSQVAGVLDDEHVRALQKRVRQLGRIYEIGGDFMSVARGLKCALSLLGICEDHLAPPLVPYDARQREQVAAVLAALGIGVEEKVGQAPA